MNTQTLAAAFNNRLETLAPKLQHIARATVGTLSEHDADDLYQTIVLKLIERAQQDPTFAQRSDTELLVFAQWRARHKASLGRIYTKYVENETIHTDDDGSEISNFELLSSDEPSPEEATIENQEISALQEAINNLAPRQRQFAILLYKGYTQTEAAAEMGISKVTAHEMKVAISKRFSHLLG